MKMDDPIASVADPGALTHRQNRLAHWDELARERDTRKVSAAGIGDG